MSLKFTEKVEEKNFQNGPKSVGKPSPDSGLNHFRDLSKLDSVSETESAPKLTKKINFDVRTHKWKQLIFSPSITQESFMRHLNTTYRGLVYSKKCLKSPSDKFIQSKQVCLVDCKGDIIYKFSICLHKLIFYTNCKGVFVCKGGIHYTILI
jgi:hypothetical protein